MCSLRGVVVEGGEGGVKELPFYCHHKSCDKGGPRLSGY